MISVDADHGFESVLTRSAAVTAGTARVMGISKSGLQAIKGRDHALVGRLHVGAEGGNQRN